MFHLVVTSPNRQIGNLGSHRLTFWILDSHSDQISHPHAHDGNQGRLLTDGRAHLAAAAQRAGTHAVPADDASSGEGLEDAQP